MHAGWDANDDVADVGVERVPHETAPLRKPKIAEVSAEIGSYDSVSKMVAPLRPGGIDMSGRRPLIKGYFAVLRLIVGAVMSSACRCGSCHPLALMLSADPLPQSRYRA